MLRHWHLQYAGLTQGRMPCLAASHSESDYSYSCGTGRTTSDMDFADALSPMSAGRWGPARRGCGFRSSVFVLVEGSAGMSS